jgi:acetyl esterase/lipase
VRSLPPSVLVLKIAPVLGCSFLAGCTLLDTTPNPPLPPLAHAREFRVVRDVSYLTAPGRPGKLDLYLPMPAPGEPPAAAVVWIHSPGWGDSTNIAPDVCGTLAGQGYVCASVSYGEAEEESVNIIKCKNVVRFLRVHAEEYHLDPARLAIGGGSLSAYYALMVGLTAGRDIWDKPATYPGVACAVSAVLDFYSPMRPREALTSVSPVSYVTKAAPPVLILQGLIDNVVLPEESAEFDHVLESRGVAHQTYFFKRMGHAFGVTIWGSGHAMKTDVRPSVLAFLREYLGRAPRSGQGG